MTMHALSGREGGKVIAQEVWRERKREDEPRNQVASNLTLLGGNPDENSHDKNGMGPWNILKQNN